MKKCIFFSSSPPFLLQYAGFLQTFLSDLEQILQEFHDEYLKYAFIQFQV